MAKKLSAENKFTIPAKYIQKTGAFGKAWGGAKKVGGKVKEKSGYNKSKAWHKAGTDLPGWMQENQRESIIERHNDWKENRLSGFIIWIIFIIGAGGLSLVFLPLLAIFVGAIGFFWLLHLMSPPGSSSRRTVDAIIKWGIVLVILGGLIFAIYMIFFTVGGSATVANFDRIVLPAKSFLQENVASQNIITSIIRGDYNFANTWRSDVQQTKYEGRDVGVKLENVRPIKDEIFTGENVIVTGTLKMIGLPASAYGTTPDFSANIKSKVGEADGEFDFEAISGKTIYALRNDAYEKLLLEERDPFKEYEIKKQLSWQTPSDVGIGIGLQGESDIFSANNDENTINHFLGVTIENKGSGKLDSVEEILLIIPNNLVVNLSKSDFKFSGSCNNELNTCDYKLTSPKFSDIIPGEKKTYFLVFKYYDDSLSGGDFKEVFVLADVKYKYTLTKLTSIIVHQPPK
ncbi:MAG: hypothetical protein J4472_01575 [DPANN group archaeon]|nr:hypothetical protein [DPANN group archaeon]